MTRSRPEPLKGLAAGLVGGFVGTLALTALQSAWSRASHALAGDPGPGGRPDPGRAALHETDRPPVVRSERDRPATARVARAVARRAFGVEPAGQAEVAASQAVHLGAGTLFGGLYGLAAELAPAVASYRGFPFGVALSWAIDHEATPRLSLSRNPYLLPPRTHAYGLASHVAYAVAAEAVRAAARRRM